MEKRITGIAVSPGIAIGKVYLFEKKEVEINKCPCKNPEEEKAKLIEGRNKTKEQLADVISIKAVNIIVAIVLFIIARIAVILLKTVLEGIAELPIIKQFNQIGGIGYGILKGFLLIYILVTLLFFVNAIVGNNKVSAVVEESFMKIILL